MEETRKKNKNNRETSLPTMAWVIDGFLAKRAWNKEKDQ